MSLDQEPAIPGQENPRVVVGKNKLVRVYAKLAYKRDNEDAPAFKIEATMYAKLLRGHDWQKSTLVAGRGCTRHPVQQDGRYDYDGAQKGMSKRY